MVQFSVPSWHHRSWTSPTHVQVAYFLVDVKPECVFFSQHIDIHTVLVYTCNGLNDFKLLDDGFIVDASWSDKLKLRIQRERFLLTFVPSPRDMMVTKLGYLLVKRVVKLNNNCGPFSPFHIGLCQLCIASQLSSLHWRGLWGRPQWIVSWVLLLTIGILGSSHKAE